MLLKTFERRLRIRLARAERAFLTGISLVAHSDRFSRRYHLEGSVSDAWQAYCDFSREICIQSALGCTLAGGEGIAPSITPASWERASYLAIRAVNRAVIHPSLLNQDIRYEPTWGDSTKIDQIITALNPGNAAQLRAHLFGGLIGPKHCQIVRNATAHKNAQTLANVKALAIDYLATPASLPTDALSWTEPISGNLAFIAWLDDMRTIADGAITQG